MRLYEDNEDTHPTADPRPFMSADARTAEYALAARDVPALGPVPMATSVHPPVRALARLIGNRHMNALLARAATPPLRLLARETKQITLGKGETVEFESEAFTASEVRATWDAIHAVLPDKLAIDSAAVAQAMQTHWERKGADKAETAQLTPLRWHYEDLLGLWLALDATRALFQPSPDMKRLPARSAFGLVSGLIDLDDKRFAGLDAAMQGRRADSGETILAADFAAVGMSASCALGIDKDIAALEPDTAGTGDAYDRREDITWKARKRRATWVHEIGHVIYPNFNKDWFLLWNKRDDVRKAGAPTAYAAKSVEEDFCESFMLFVLYPDKRPLLGERLKFFEARPPLVSVAKTVAQKRASPSPLSTPSAGVSKSP
jgi:hypothetical protein